ncbi:hypothetical protein SAMN02745133_02198 [Desulforamulus putei DSM 12395]|uniref:Uncharacterized protein n=1 Tax=Desulforamulus putei DSM 12395 TaxID=1121429 RepID=A0A1M5A731_9FIRM|nr:hypothetical protein SAMN02745133_02198 [Desulforamulus putei DSM 12395]
MVIESGDYCNKYEAFITREVVNKCDKYKEESFKGCSGSKCDHHIHKVIVKEE